MSSGGIRQPAVAGTFYPAHPGKLAGSVDRLLDKAPMVPGLTAPAALVAPHAGYAYSGPTAATAYAQLRTSAAAVTQVVLLGPAHFVPVSGLAVPSSTAFATPLGPVRVDVDACRRLVADHRDVGVGDAAHEPEHSLEVQLPILQRVLRAEFSVVPLVVGGASAGAVADVLDDLAVPGALVIVSSDLSHYLDEPTARRRDSATAAAILDRDGAAIGSRDACGAYPLGGLLEWAVRHDHHVTQLDLSTSADTAGDRSRVVGYGAFWVDQSSLPSDSSPPSSSDSSLTTWKRRSSSTSTWLPSSRVTSTS